MFDTHKTLPLELCNVTVLDGFEQGIIARTSPTGVSADVVVRKRGDDRSAELLGKGFTAMITWRTKSP